LSNPSFLQLIVFTFIENCEGNDRGTRLFQ
jgi:hypothetical protein